MTLVFLHIDKTGGMSVRELLAWHFAPEAIRPVVHHPQACYQPTAYPTVYEDLHSANRRFEHDPAHTLVMGHYDWSVVERMMLQGHDRPDVVTVLRDPVNRAASLWRWLCQEEALFGIESRHAREMGFDRWARLHVSLYANVMTRQLAGVRWGSLHDRAEDTAIIFALAVNHLRQCALVGLYERLDMFMTQLAGLVGADQDRASTPDLLPHVNRSAQAIAISEDTADYIRRESWWDVELYELVRWKYGA